MTGFAVVYGVETVAVGAAGAFHHVGAATTNLR
jgi:hypothetical protein